METELKSKSIKINTLQLKIKNLDEINKEMERKLENLLIEIDELKLKEVELNKISR